MTEILKKYAFFDSIVRDDGVALHRIYALRNFGNVKAGDLGGYVQSEDNLSHEGNCWIYDQAVAYENATVFGNASLKKNAEVKGEALIDGSAVVTDFAKIQDKVIVNGSAHICGNAKLFGNCIVSENAIVSDYASAYDICEIKGRAIIRGNAAIWSNAIIRCDCTICGDTVITTDGYINKPNAYVTITNCGEANMTFTFYKTILGKVRVFSREFEGDFDYFKAYVTDINDKELKALIDYIEVILSLRKN